MDVNLNLLQWAVLQVSAVLQGMAKGGIPGMGTLSVPLAAFALPAKASTGVVLPMLILGDAVGLSYWRRSADWRSLLRALPWAFCGIAAGSWCMNQISDRELRPLIGIIVLVMLGLHNLRLWLKRNDQTVIKMDAVGFNSSKEEVDARYGSPFRRRLFAALMGFMGGLTTMIANAAGPVMAMYLLALRLPKAAFIGTTAWFFFIVNWVKVPFSVKLGLINLQSLSLNLCLVPALLAGVVLGIIIVNRISDRVFEVVIQILTVISAVNLFL